MPRRPRLSIPPMFMESGEGFAIWDIQGHLIDHNQAFARMFGSVDDTSSFAASTFDSRAKIRAPVQPPEAAFHGEVAGGLVARPDDPSVLFRIDAWPVNDDEGAVVAVLGRFRSVTDQEKQPVADPSLTWGAQLQDELLRRRASQRAIGLESIVGHGPDHDQLLRRIETVVKANCSLVILGEAATGRHHIARVVHGRWQAMSRTRQPLVPLDARSLPSEMLAQDFLGVEPASEGNRAFVTEPKWRLPVGSTVLIENLADLDSRLQDNIDRAQENVRLIGLARSRHDLESLDLAFRSRIETVVIELQPLRKRIDELPLLVQFLLDRIQAESPKRLDGFTPAAMERLRLYDWPGNWRELERIVKKILETAKGPLVSPEEVPAEIQGAYGGAWAKPATHQESQDQLEDALVRTRRVAVQEALERFGSNKAAAARALGVSRPKLYRLISELGLEQ